MEYGRPTNLSEPHGQVATGATSHGQESFSYATASAANPGGGSNIIAFDRNLQPLLATASTANLTLGPLSESRWTGGQAATGTTVSGADPYVSVIFPVPPGSTKAIASDGAISALGSFSVYVWDAAVLVNDVSGERRFESGETVRGVGPQPPGQQHPVREREFRLLRLDAVDATLEVRTSGRSLQWVAPALTIQGDVEATLRGSTGAINHAGDWLALANEDLAIEGPIILYAWNETADASRLSGRLEASPAAMGFPAEEAPARLLRVLGARPVPPASDPGGPGWLAAALLSGGAAILGITGYRRFRTARIEDVEWALLRGRPRQAETLARRLVKKNPRHADAVFLYGASLLARKRHRQLLRDLAPLLERLGAHEQPTIAFLLSISAHECGETLKARRWSARAASDPVLRARMLRDEGAVPVVSADPFAGYA